MVKAIWAVACSVLVVLTVAVPHAHPVFAQEMDNSAKIRRPIQTPTDSASDPSYRLGPEDQLRISVWDNKELSLDLVVRPDGKISMPLLQDVPAEGLTAVQLATKIEEGLSAYIVNPVVTVIVLQVNAPKYYVIGYVGHPGTYPLRGDTSVLQALALAGGLTQWASPRSIKLIRATHGKQEVQENKLLQHHRCRRRGELPPQIRRYDRGAVMAAPGHRTFLAARSILLATLFALVPRMEAAAIGLKVDLVPSARIEEVWESNVSNSTTNEVSSLATRATPGLALNFKTADGVEMRFSGNYEKDLVPQSEVNQSNNDTYHFRVDSTGDVRLTPTFYMVPSVNYINTTNSFRRTQLVPSGDPVVPPITITNYGNAKTEDFGGGVDSIICQHRG